MNNSSESRDRGRTDVAVAADGHVIGQARASSGATVHAGQAVGVEIARVAHSSTLGHLSFVTTLRRLDAAGLAVEFHWHAVHRRASHLAQAFADSIANQECGLVRLDIPTAVPDYSGSTLSPCLGPHPWGLLQKAPKG